MLLAVAVLRATALWYLVLIRMRDERPARYSKIGKHGAVSTQTAAGVGVGATC
jgi:hypothetical protein